MATEQPSAIDDILAEYAGLQEQLSDPALHDDAATAIGSVRAGGTRNADGKVGVTVGIEIAGGLQHAPEAAEHGPVVHRLRRGDGGVGVAHVGPGDESALEDGLGFHAEERGFEDDEVGEFADGDGADDVADAVGLHESTISRVTTQKYMLTPRGIYELKYFFGSHVETDTGGECSAIAIRALIKQLIANEDQKKPLSDSTISEVLAKQGIVVARRTVAKYREAMQIPPVNQRKSL